MGESLRIRAEAYAFRQLVAHLQERTDVQNIDVMNLAGFCRNCMSKWLCAGARQEGWDMPYDDACEDVYGMPYKDWKKQHQTPATEQQMALFKQSSAGHAKHTPLEPTPAAATTATPIPAAPTAGKSSVCCQDVPEVEVAAPAEATLTPMRLAILTVSDRASQGVYEDESGPEIQKTVSAYAAATNAYSVEVVASSVVPDDAAQIESTLRGWVCGARAPNLILSTGGTGLSRRDVTPEATLAVVEKQIPGMTEVLRRETSRHVPHAVLSRAVAGASGNSLIVNLPGRPKACRECLAVLLPLLQHALEELSKST
eukprot:TRINITY_DN16159_c1_g1_i1.p1 TRINITY_DN16159_c1_g1~~TRINITY_DN16159_c1_g1_i1.p1  ORF type:complete len:328 (+),score=91.13 TRINITY_DN16159_c1_g1_i1:48-986(+)